MTVPGRIFAVVLFMGMAAAFSVGVGIIQRPPAPEFPRPASARPRPRPYILPIQYAEWVIRYCDETGVPVWLACRLFAWESGWRVSAWRDNDDGSVDRGIAQLNSNSLGSFASLYNDGQTIDPVDPETAIRVGIRFLSALHAELKSWRAAVGAYNVGLGAWRVGARPVRHMREVFGE